MATKISEASEVSTLSDSYALPLSTGGSSANKVTVSTLAEYAVKYCSGIGVLLISKSVTDTRPRIVDFARYINSLTGDYDALGLIIPSGSTRLVVALDEPDDTMYWSSSETLYDTEFSTSKTAAADYDGEGHAEAAALTESGYAMGYCSTYSKAGDSGRGIPAGSWWLPSGGEMISISMNYHAIDFALSALSAVGIATTNLRRATYWTSTERSASSAWLVETSYASFSTGTKTSSSYRVRPVTAIQNYSEI